MGMMKEFREFAVKGNVVDLAVAVIIGGAFGRIVDSVVQDLIMPLVGKVLGGLDFSNYYIPLNNQGTTLALAEAKKAGAVFAYGNFLTILLNFIILAFIIFQMVRVINKLKRGGTGSACRHPGRNPAAARNPRFAEEVTPPPCPLTPGWARR